ncbi:alpha/beta fold hydrolase [Tellurirhabdus rosea]|uniref:alpha/beta fold hydrolase n=1 Tax=Tellurirhabdus rosea TaxID=2674997 RepID=UPI0022531547|nr:alpha/beta hydrolase [Tellurirhabdus rosea]
MFRFPYRTFLLLALPCLLSGCFRRWAMSEREITAHYASRPVKPRFVTIENDSVRLFCASVGADTLPPLLLIHGAPGAWYGYLRMLDDSLLQRHYNLISVDRPNYGKSRKRRHRTITSIDRQAHAIALALSANRSGRPALVLGRSFGAPIAARLAMLYPDKVRHLVMVAPAIDPDREKFWWFSGWARFPLVQLFLPRQLNTATAEKYSHVKELKKLTPHWPQLRVPTTILQGGKDWIVDPANLDFARRQLAGKDTEFFILPEAGHLITSSHPSLVRELLLRCTDEPLPGGGAELSTVADKAPY